MKWLLIFAWVHSPGVTVETKLTFQSAAECLETASKWTGWAQQKGFVITSIECGSKK